MMKGSVVPGEYGQDAAVMTRSALTAISGALAILSATPARGAAQPCDAIAVDADAAAVSRFPEMPERIREAFAERRDVDACARVHLGLAGGGSIELQVSLPDGRSTSRSAQPEEVVPVLEALLLVPSEPDPAPAAAAAVAPSTSAPSSIRFEPAALEVPRDGDRPARPGSRFAVELSLGAGMHRGDGQSSESLGASSFLEAASWLVGFAARIDHYDRGTTGDTGDAPSALEVGALLGRRFGFGGFTFDAAAGPALALRGSWSVMAANSASSGMVSPVRSSSSHNDLVPRCLFSGRLTLGRRSVVRTFAGIEAELGEAGPIPPGGARGLPLWTVGGALGVTLGTL
jgi:hypothetical protein